VGIFYALLGKNRIEEALQLESAITEANDDDWKFEDMIENMSQAIFMIDEFEKKYKLP
jgi:hypothetical protein